MRQKDNLCQYRNTAYNVTMAISIPKKKTGLSYSHRIDRHIIFSAFRLLSTIL